MPKAPPAPPRFAVDGHDFRFGDARSKIADVLGRAGEPREGDSLDLITSIAAGCARMPRAAWPSFAEADPGFAEASASGQPGRIGPALIEAIRAAAADLGDASAHLLEAGERARLHLLGKVPPRDPRRAALARPVTAAPGDSPSGRTVVLRGGPFGAGVGIRAAGPSRLERAALAWTLALAPWSKPRQDRPAQKRALKEEQELPAVVLVDGIPVAAGRLAAEGLAALAGAIEAGAPFERVDADAFEARATRERDDGDRLGGELDDLGEIASGSSLPDLSAEDRALARRLAGELRAGPGSAPRLHAIRERVREDLAPPAAGRGSRSLRFATGPERRLAWARALAADAGAEEARIADAAEAEIVAAWAASPPGACGVLLAPGAPHPEDPWLAEVARAAARAELDALDARLTRPGPRAKAAALRAAALPDRPGLAVEILARVADARDAALGLWVPGAGGALRRNAAESLLAVLWSGPQLAKLGPGGVAVAVRLPAVGDAWRVVAGQLPAMLAAGYVEITPGPGGLPFASPALDGSDDEPVALADAAVAWAVARWAEAGHGGPPPELADAVRAARATLAALWGRRADPPKRGRGRRA